ncbi:hypothetical protein [Thermococcus barophilus]|uniref:Uncharacterized protein n=1 Tax=Thermococcus barophilus TaxID=55802 RepID=A0A0S1XEV0_THEBA|nr:hypothetical protein [Thermococcus barophilus]ALM76311.1 conserved exported hypothetical protein [Thermococcus barophilus]
MRRRGFVLTLDALLSLLLIMIFVSTIAVIENNVGTYTTYMREQEKYIAEDTLTLLRSTSLKELVPPQKIQEWLADGTLNTTLVSPDMSPLDIVSTYWATELIYPSANLRHKAEIILGYILNRTLMGYNYELMINNYTSPYLRKTGSNSSRVPNISPATLILSGYAYNQTPRGYMARAYLTKATYRRQEIIGIQRVLAYCGVSNTFRVEVPIRLPDDASINSADIRLVARTSAQYSYFELNNVTLPLGTSDITNILHGGLNVLEATFTPASWYCYEMGFGSGSTLFADYTTNSLSVEDPATRYGELYQLESDRTGIYYLNALFVPGNITEINIHLETEGVRDIRIYYSYGSYHYELVHKTVPTTGRQIVDITNSEIVSALASYGFTYENLSRTYFKLIIALDSWWDESQRRFVYDTTPRRRILYGYGASRIEIKYIPRVLVTQYSIPLSIFIDYNDITYNGPCYGVRCAEMTFDYTLPENAKPWYVDIWTAIQFTTFTPDATMTLSENGYTFYDYYPDIYLIRVAYTRLTDTMMVPGRTNTFRAYSTDAYQFGFREGESRGVVNYFIEGYAGYGDVFPQLLQGYPRYKGYNLTYWYYDGSSTYQRQILIGDPPYKLITVDDLDPQRYAVDDAILRLFNNLNYINDVNPDDWKTPPYDGSQNNPIDVDLPEGVKIAFASMGEIPGLFKPITITLRVWREQ